MYILVKYFTLEIIENFWEDQLKEEEFKRKLKEKRPATATFRRHGYSQTSLSNPFQTKKDFSALQHAKQAAVSRIYEPATATFEPHGFSQTSFSIPYFKAKVNIHLVRSVSIQDFVNDAHCSDCKD